jgi:hypothetical protein
MPQGQNKPLLNPILVLLKEPRPTAAKGGGQGEKGVFASRLSSQREYLSGAFNLLSEQRNKLKTHSGKMHIIAKMFPDSHAPSWTPSSFFEPSSGCSIVAPAYNGYLVEVDSSCFEKIASVAEKGKSVDVRTDISRIESVAHFDSKECLRNQNIDELWRDAKGKNGEHSFTIWLLPFFDAEARKSVIDELLELYHCGALDVPSSGTDQLLPLGDIVRLAGRESEVPAQLVKVIRAYRTQNRATITVAVASSDSLAKIAAAGISYRIEPVTSLQITSSPGVGPEPTPSKISSGSHPAVVIVDGGRSAKSYGHLELWAAPPLVSNSDADQLHGNRITSLICQGHAWNSALSLPALECNFVTAQAITKSSASKEPSRDQFIQYLSDLAVSSKKYSRVWNMSFNEIAPSTTPEEVSFLGHAINKIAREHSILPVISIGNKGAKNNYTLCPPADCEAALTVGGRENDSGIPGKACKNGLRGPAPAGMKKPELSWFSTLRTIGGGAHTGTSYSTTLVSSLAAHAFANLKDPTPDLVRAILLNSAELEMHDDSLGWGTPWSDENLPWVCQDGTVTLTWRAKLKPGFSYHWSDIPIPPEMLENGKIKGFASLTAILQPLTSELGGVNYFATRLQVAIQAVNASGKTINLLGTMKESKLKEDDARKDLAKWSPVRRHSRRFKKGVSVSGTSVRLLARVFARDLYQFGYNDHHEVGEQEVAIVLSFKSENSSSSIYNSMKQTLGAYVESAVIDQHIEVDIDIDDLI